MEIVGKVISVLPIQQGTSASTGNPWKIKTFVIETFGNYPRKVAIEIFGDQCIQDNPCEVDQVVTASIEPESREYNGRWYTSIRAWRVQQGDTTAAPAAAPVAQPAAPAQQAYPQTVQDMASMMGAAPQGNTDLPF